MRVGRAPHPVDAGAEKFVEYVVFVGGNHQLVNRQAHHAGHMARAHITEVATGHAKADALAVVGGGLQVAGKVVHHLRHQPRPIDGVHRSNAVAPLEFQIAGDAFDQVLAIVKHAFDCDVDDVVVHQAEHLRLLKRAHAAQWACHEDPYAFFTAHSVLGGATGVAAGRPKNVQLFALARQMVFKQIAQQLHGHVFEGQRRSVGQAQQIQAVFQAGQWRDLRRTEHRRCVGFAAQSTQIIRGDVIDVQGQNFIRQIGVIQAAPAGQRNAVNLRVALRQVQAAIGSQAL